MMDQRTVHLIIEDALAEKIARLEVQLQSERETHHRCQARANELDAQLKEAKKRKRRS